MSDIAPILNSRILGSGKNLIILHGLYGSSDNWLTIGNKLANNFTVHLLDLRNHGRSFHSEEHNYSVMCMDVKRYMEAHSITKCILIGHSMGGKVAMLFTITYPSCIEKLIVLDIAPKNYKNNIQGHVNMIKAMKSLNIENLKTRNEIANLAMVKLKQEKLVHLLLKNIYRNKKGTFSWKLNLDSIDENIFEIANGVDKWKKIQVKTPTLFLRGEESNYIKEQDYFFIQPFFTTFEVHTVNKAGHWLHAEKPYIVIDEILNFTLEE